MNVAASSALAIGGQNLKFSNVTSQSLTPPNGKAEWTASMRGYLARAGLLPAEAQETPEIYGRMSVGSYRKPVQLSFSLSACRDSPENTKPLSPTLRALAMDYPNHWSRTLPIWARPILENDTGPWATPTTKANQCARSMQKWPSCRRLTQAIGGTLTPEIYEWMMGWPVGHTDTRQSETVKSRSKPLRLG